MDQRGASRVQAPFKGVNWIFASCPIVGRANPPLIQIIAPRRNGARKDSLAETTIDWPQIIGILAEYNRFRN
jgi:hypothetical protein